MSSLEQIFFVFIQLSNSNLTSISCTLFSSSSDIKAQFYDKYSQQIQAIKQYLDTHEQDATTLPPRQRSQFFFLKALFTSTSYEIRHECLLRAVKFNPNAIEAWNALGHCLFERMDLGGAKKSYERAVLVGKNSPPSSNATTPLDDEAKQAQLFWKKQTIIALRELSVVMRLISNTVRDPEQIKQMVRESYEHAKEAVMLDFADGESWTIMGNALLCRYLRSKDMADMDSALQAYTRALNTPDANVNAQLHFNRANVCKFKQRYQQAFEGYNRAKELEKSFKEAHEEVERLTTMMNLIADIVHKHGGMKKKRLKKFVEHIPADQSTSALTLMDDTGKPFPWKEGTQEGKHLTLRVVQLVNEQTDTPLVFIGTDRNANFFLFSIYNVDASAIKDGDLVTVRDPELGIAELPEEILGKPFNHVNVIARDPSKVAVNSRSITSDKIVAADLTMDTK